MRSKISALFVCIASLILVSTSQAWPQCGPQCQAVCQGGSGGGCPGGGGGATTRQVDPEAQRRYEEYLEIRRQNRLKESALASNSKGAADYKKGDYAKALKEFQDAYRTWPADVYMKNMTLAADQLGIRIDAEAENKIAAVNATTAAHISESQVKAQEILATGAKATGSGSTAAFGIPANPDKPPLADGSLRSSHVGSALEQASSMANSGAAAETATDPEVMKAISNCGSDTAPCAAPSQYGVARPVQSAAAIELAGHLPDGAKTDPTIQKRMKEFDSFAAHQQETERKITVLDQKIKAGDPNADALKAYQADLVNQATQDKQQEKDTKTAIKNQVQNLGLDWVEEPAAQAAKP